jgi:hypothetical protein
MYKISKQFLKHNHALYFWQSAAVFLDCIYGVMFLSAKCKWTFYAWEYSCLSIHFFISVLDKFVLVSIFSNLLLEKNIEKLFQYM